MSKKVLYLCPNNFLGGAERFVLNICIGHKKFGEFKPSVFFLKRGPIQEFFEKEEIDYKISSHKLRLRNIQQWFKVGLEIREHIKNERFDVIHLTMAYSHVLTWFFLFGVNIKKVFFVHGPISPFWERLAKLFPCDLTLVNSDYTYKEYSTLFPNLFKLNLEKFLYPILLPGKSKARLDIDESKFTFSFFGRITPWKNVEQVIKAFNLMDNDIKINSQLIIFGTVHYGRDEDYFLRLQKFVEEFQLKEQIIFYGHIDDVRSGYEASNCNIHCSSTPEPYGLVIAESFFAKTICLSNGFGGAGEIYDKNSSFIFDGSTKGLSLKMEEVFKDHEKMSVELIKMNERISIEQSLESKTKHLENLFNHLLH